MNLRCYLFSVGMKTASTKWTKTTHEVFCKNHAFSSHAVVFWMDSFICSGRSTQVEVLIQTSLWKYPFRQFLPMKIPRQTNNANDPDIASFKFLVRSCARSKTLMKGPVQTKMRYDTDFGSFHLWKDLERPKKFMIQTLDRSVYEKTGAKKYR